MRLTQATAECPVCERRFHQIDGTEERALTIVREALDKHITADHQSGDPR